MKKWTKILIIVSSVLVFCVSAVFAGYAIYKPHYMKKELDLPMVYINTEDGKEITSKEDYLGCNITITNTNEEYQLKKESAKIRGRGNSTWELAKKPYRIKFDKKVNLFGNGTAKSWTLIANHQDNSLIRNYLAFSIADTFDDLMYTSTTQFVDVILNGEYIGVYLVCEQIQTGTNRVDIDESLDVVDTGYLLELDERASSEGVENIDYFVYEDLSFAIKTPDTEDEDYTVEHLNFIKNYINETFAALKGGDYSKVLEYVDVNTFADSYIINELFKNNDVGNTSFYVYKDAGGKLCSGPIWDYDSCAGNSPTSATGVPARSNKTDTIWADLNRFYNYLLKYDEFKEIVADKLVLYKKRIQNVIEEKTVYVLNNYAKSFKRNFYKWGRYISRLDHLPKWKDQVLYLQEWLNDSLDYMYNYYVK